MRQRELRRFVLFVAGVIWVGFMLIQYASNGQDGQQSKVVEVTPKLPREWRVIVEQTTTMGSRPVQDDVAGYVRYGATLEHTAACNGGWDKVNDLAKAKVIDICGPPRPAVTSASGTPRSP